MQQTVELADARGMSDCIRSFGFFPLRLFPLLLIDAAWSNSRNVLRSLNVYSIYFVSKGTGPRTVQIEAQNQAGAKEQVEA
jgi:hypothetical protein